MHTIQLLAVVLVALQGIVRACIAVDSTEGIVVRHLLYCTGIMADLAVGPMGIISGIHMLHGQKPEKDTQDDMDPHSFHLQ